MTLIDLEVARREGWPAAAAWELVQRTQAGDMDAWAELWRRYHSTVYRFLRFRCAHRQTAEDLTSETFLRALHRIASFTWQGRDFGAWLVTIARNLLADHYKGGRYRFEVVIDATSFPQVAEGGHARAPHAPPDPAGVAVEHEAARVLRAALPGLTPEQREVVELRFYSGLSVAQTAAKLGVSEGAVKAMQYRAVRSLARHPAIRALAPELVRS